MSDKQKLSNTGTNAEEGQMGQAAARRARRLATRIRQELKTRRMTVTQLAEKSGLSKSSVSDILNEKSMASLDTAAKLADGLGLTVPMLHRSVDACEGTRGYEDIVLALPSSVCDEDEILTLLLDIPPTLHDLFRRVFETKYREGCSAGRAYAGIRCSRIARRRVLTLQTRNDEDSTYLGLDSATTWDFEVTCKSCGFLTLRAYEAPVNERERKSTNYKSGIDPKGTKIPRGVARLRRRLDNAPGYAEALFEPPLAHKEEATLTFSERFGDAHVAERESLHDRLKSARFVRDCVEQASCSVNYQTDLLINEVVFPAGYEPDELAVDVIGGPWAVPGHWSLREERDRIYGQRGFDVETDDQGRLVCRLQVRGPLAGCRYAIQWRPMPREKYLPLLEAAREAANEEEEYGANSKSSG